MTKPVLIVPRSKRYHTSLECEKVDADKAIVSDLAIRKDYKPCNTAACSVVQEYVV